MKNTIVNFLKESWKWEKEVNRNPRFRSFKELHQEGFFRRLFIWLIITFVFTLVIAVLIQLLSSS